MKIITSKLTLLIILSTTIVVSSLTISQTSMAVAVTVDENSVSLHSISAQNLDTTSDSNQYHTSFDWSNPSASKMTDVLTASFTNILDTQIYSGLQKVTN
jgi:ABC-type oligopeptide transport system substrate-binding subunit